MNIPKRNGHHIASMADKGRRLLARFNIPQAARHVATVLIRW